MRKHRLETDLHQGIWNEGAALRFEQHDEMIRSNGIRLFKRLPSVSHFVDGPTELAAETKLLRPCFGRYSWMAQLKREAALKPNKLCLLPHQM